MAELNHLTDKIRIDKYLWAVRIFKTRNLASIACNAGKIKIDGNSIKPSRLIGLGELVSVQKDFINYSYKIKGLTERRVSAKLVINFVEDLTPADEILQKKEMRKSSFYRPRGLGRPTKKERRDIDKLRDSD